MSGRIVVGVDGSEAALGAARWAAAEAVMREAKLELVSAWEVPAATYGHVYEPAVSEELSQAVKGAAKERAEAALEEARRERPQVQAEVLVAAGQPVGVLVRESEHADLLVVGSRGLGGFRGLMLGSVSQQCAQHASCPVVIVRHSPTD